MAAATWAPFRDEPALAAVFTDFDGTLSPIVDDPAAARPLPGSAEQLGELARRVGRVGILSGRPVSFLTPLFDPAILLVGLYGLELVVGGRRHDHPLGGTWREVVDDVAASARSGLPGDVLVEPKGLSLTLHYRGAPGAADAVLAFGGRQALRSGLVCRPAKMSVELHPPIDVDKGTALLDHTAGLASVCFIGDDEGDLPAFDALDRLADEGVHTIRVAVTGEETSAALLARADVSVEGPEGVLDLLTELTADG